MEKRRANRLINESSPYLLQHAYNPVDWYPWGSEALAKAVELDKPILVSIGYSACHWCHVMERESFENEQVASLMNDKFICIKVDREERPDIDHIYMDAIQAISGQGGWPLNMFLTPAAKPFYGGTYFPPVDAYGRPSWTQILTGVHNAFTTNRDGINDQADKLTGFLENSDNNLVSNTIVNIVEGEKLFIPADADKVFRELEQRFDKINGGFGTAPKFPNTLSIQYLLHYHYYTGNKAALEHALLSLKKMIYGGICDQVGGGFARYSTDDHWLAPHFEKMLYDNALLVSTLSEAYKLTADPLYKNIVIQTIEYLQREMTADENGFYSALDADSEGHEGKFYVWDKKEVEDILGQDAFIFCKYYDITNEGNWEDTNILNVKTPLKQFAKLHNLNEDDLTLMFTAANKKLLSARSARIRPGLDDKIILSWNAMMCSACVKAYEAFNNETYLHLAKRNMDFLLNKFLIEKDGLKVYHTYKNGIAKHPAFLDDYACLIEAMIDLYEANFNEQLLTKAEMLAEIVLRDFYDGATGQFYYTPVYQDDIIVRKKELFDSVTPSGNSTMAINLSRLSIITGRNDLKEIEIRMMQGIKTSLLNYSSSFSKWATHMLTYIFPHKEIAIVGADYQTIAKQLRQAFIPNRILMASDGAKQEQYPLLQGRSGKKDTLIYLCEDYTCKAPYNDVNLLLNELAIQSDSEER